VDILIYTVATFVPNGTLDYWPHFVYLLPMFHPPFTYLLKLRRRLRISDPMHPGYTSDISNGRKIYIKSSMTRERIPKFKGIQMKDLWHLSCTELQLSDDAL